VLPPEPVRDPARLRYRTGVAVCGDDAVPRAWPRASLSLSADIHRNVVLDNSHDRMYLGARSVEMGTFKMTDSPSATRARALLPRRDAVRGVRVHDDHGAPRNGEHLDLERLARDGVHFAGAPLLLDLVVGVGVGPVEEPAAAVVAEEVRSVDGLE
jgi:hypothetical protein